VSLKSVNISSSIQLLLLGSRQRQWQVWAPAAR
jgi:hypothetical protein